MPRSLHEWLQIQVEENTARMLEELSIYSGIPLADIMASQFEEPRAEIRTGELGEFEETIENEPEIEQDFSGNIEDYFDSLFDDLDIDYADEDDAYADAEI